MKNYLCDGTRLYLEKLVDWESYFRLRKGEDVDVEEERGALIGVVEMAAQICSELEPDNRAGWYENARLEDGVVVYPPHIERAYKQLAEAGLVCVGIEEQYGGFGLPGLVNNILLQMIARTDAGLMTIVGLQAGAADDIQLYASEELKQAYLPRFVSGEIMGAMDLTEPQAGSDLGAIATRATEEDGRFFIDGEKIYITNGGCEVHLVLARDDDTFDESRGTTRGLSLYLCPRTLPDGTRNRVEVTRLEDKLGIHGSPTAALAFERAEAFRIGVKGEGFKAMLTLMNNARLGVAAQGVGITEAALRAAIEYAGERKQFGKPIAEQPLMKNFLARMTVALEGSRALLYRACVLMDSIRAIETALARGGISEAEKGELQRMHERNLTRVRLLTPLAKYLATETADEVSRNAIQVFGGLGFMAESEVGKLHSDAIITTIYEGTSEIQVSFALKEIGRGALTVVFDEMAKELEELTEEPLRDFADKLRHGIELIEGAFGSLMQDFNYALMCAEYLAHIVVTVVAGVELLKQAKVDPTRFDLAASWINRRMPELEGRVKRINEGGVESIEKCERIVAMAG